MNTQNRIDLARNSNARNKIQRFIALEFSADGDTFQLAKEAAEHGPIALREHIEEHLEDVENEFAAGIIALSLDLINWDHLAAYFREETRDDQGPSDLQQARAGRAISDAKAAAARENGKKGGRPAKSKQIDE